MKRIYSKPVIEVESFVTEEIMQQFKTENVLSYNPVAEWGGYQDGMIKFSDGDGNVLNSIRYEDFAG